MPTRAVATMPTATTAATTKSTTATATATILNKQSVIVLIRRVVLLFVAAMLLGIGNWLFLGLPLMPTISNTWTKPPASYVSRYVVCTCWITFEVAQLVIYRSNQDVGPNAKASWVNKLCLVVAAVCVFCLSWVGAICDSKDDTCRGDDDIHLFFALTFFIGYNMYMVILTIRAHQQHTWKLRSVLYACVLLSIITKLRSIPAGFDFSEGWIASTNNSVANAVGSSSLVAIFEWTDVAVIMVWTSAYMAKRNTNFGIATVRLTANAGKNGAAIVTDSGTQVLNRISGFTLATLTTLVLALLLVVSFVVEVFVTGAVPLPTVLGGNASWPTESSLWVSAPGNWFARWALASSSVLILAWNSLALRTFPTGKHSCAQCIAALAGFIGTAGLALAGCVNAFEAQTEHELFMSLAFAGLNGFAMLTAAIYVNEGDRHKCKIFLIALAIFATQFRDVIDTDVAVTVINATATTVSANASNWAAALTSVVALMQWLNSFLLMLFMVMFTWANMAAFEKIALAIVYTPPASLRTLLRRANLDWMEAGKKAAAGGVPVAVTYAKLPKAEGNDDDEVTVVTARLVNAEE